MDRISQSESDRMSDLSFRGMQFLFRLVDFFFPRIDRRVQQFGLEEGMVVVDHGCGPGRYTTRFSRLVGEVGKVYAVDIHELAVDAIERIISRDHIQNIVPVLAQGYDSTLPDQVADIVCAIDIFFMVKEPTAFLAELRRITKDDGMLIIDDGHQSRTVTRERILASGHWTIWQETHDHLKCKPSPGSVVE